MNSCGCMTRDEREAKIRKYEQTLMEWKAKWPNHPRTVQLEQMIDGLKAKHQAICADESPMHGLPGTDCEHQPGPFDLV